MNKKYYDGFDVISILFKNLEPRKALKVLEAFAEYDGVDAVEVVRCKNCKYRDPEDHKCDCGHDIRWQLPREDNWFCADAERRKDNG